MAKPIAPTAVSTPQPVSRPATPAPVTASATPPLSRTVSRTAEAQQRIAAERSADSLKARAQALGLPPTANLKQIEAAERRAHAGEVPVPAKGKSVDELWGLKPSKTEGVDDWVKQTPPDANSWAKFIDGLKQTDPKRSLDLDSQMKQLEKEQPFSVFTQRWDTIVDRMRKKDPAAADALLKDMYQSRFGEAPPAPEPAQPGEPEPPPTDPPGSSMPVHKYEPWELETIPDSESWKKLMTDLREKDPARADSLETMMKGLEDSQPFSVFDQRWDQVVEKLGPEAGKALKREMFQSRFPGEALPDDLK